MYQKIEECPLCQSGYFSNYLICKDHSISGESFAIVQCENCGFRFTNPRPGPESIINYYNSDSYVSITNKANNFTNFIYKIARIFTIRQKTRLISSLTKIGTVLDVGCGTGEFLKGCQNKGWRVVGVEPSEARDQATKATSSNIYFSIEQLPVKDKYEIITLWHVLEHLPDLNLSMTRFRKILKKKGRLIVAVPNNESWDAGNYKDFWAGYDVPRHFYHFTQATMKRLCTANKLKINQILPMRLDSYYASLLSEKYGHSENAKPSVSMYAQAFLNGIKSNSWARKNDNNYSSLIYVISNK